MTIHFATIDFNHTHHAKCLADGLVLGFAVFDYMKGTETLYSLDKEGNMLSTGERKRLPTFKSKVWVKVDSIPPQAEFIGHYRKD